MRKSPKLESREKRHRKTSENFGFIDYNISNERAAATSASLTLYGVFVLLLGCVLPFSDTLVKFRKSCDQYSLEIFYILQSTTSIMGIIFLEWLIRTNSKNKIFTSSKREINDIQEKDEDEIECDTKTASCELEGKNTMNQENAEIQSESSLLDKETTQFTKDKRRTHPNNKKADSCTNRNLKCKKSIIQASNLSEGVNLYLRIGAAGFGFFVMVYDGLTLGSMLVKGIFPSDGTKFLKHLLHLSWIILQTFFIFKNHRIVFNTQKLLVRFITVHLIVANIGQWVKIIIYEIQEELSIKHTYELHQDLNETIETNRSVIILDCTHKFLNSILHQFEAYLFPCVIEYSLITAGIFMKIFQKIGRLEEEEKKMKILKQFVSKRNNCDKSHTGLAAGMFISMIILTLVIIFIALKEKSGSLDKLYIIQQTADIILMMSTTIICVAIYIKTRQMHYHPMDEEEAFDINLLLICVGGVLTYNLFVLVSSAEIININSKKYGLKAVLSLTRSLCEIVQCILQTGLVMVASTRWVKNKSDAERKPGRSLIMLLLICNLALWVENTFPIKLIERRAIQTKIYNEQAWRIISRTFLPLRIFFRFHSTVCLYDIWGRNYQSRHFV